ncbi:hypothetical protein DFH27DRAFT_270993 [Peziza echinospora]|nr:hypothetical protein DFH27DRAFT_270993 [Peziza echinospora]
MLERFCRHLESGGLGILRTKRPSRMLQSAVWVHGAEGLESPPPFHPGGALACDVDPFNRRAPGERLYLSFLYPSKTLAFLKQLPRHSLRCRSTIIKTSPTHHYQCKRFYSSTSATNAGLPGTSHTTKSNRYADLRTLLNGEPGLYEEAWRHYQNEPETPPRNVNRLMSYLKYSERQVDQARVLKLAEKLESSQFDSQGCDSLVHVYLHRSLLDEAIMVLRKLADVNILVTMKAAIRLITYGINHARWILAAQGYEFLCRADIGAISADKVAAQVEDFRAKFLDWLKERPLDSYHPALATWLGNGGIIYSTSKNNPESALDAFHILNGLHLEGLGAKIKLQQFLETMRQLQEHKLYTAATEAYLIYRDTPLQEAPTAGQISSLLYGTLLAFGQLEDFRNMERVFDDWFHFGARPNEQSCLFIMRQFAAKGETTVVQEFYDYYEKRFPMRVEALEAVMHAHAIRGEVGEVKRWFQKISDLELQPTRVTYNILLNAYKEADDISSAFKCFKTMLKLKPENRPDLITYQTIMSLCANRGDLESLDVFTEAMKEQKIPITQSIHNAISLAHAKQHTKLGADEAFDLAKQITLEKLEQPSKEKFHDVDPSRMWNNVLVGYIWAGDLEGLAATYHHMRQQEVQFDAYTYSILLHSLCMSGKVREAERMFDILVEEGTVKLNQAHYATLMLDSMIRKDIAKVWSTYNRMLEAGLTPTFITQAILIQAVTTAEYREYRKSGGILFLPEAEAILSQSTSDLSILDLTSPDTVKSAIPPFLFIPLIQVYAREGSTQRMLELFERFTMIQRRQHPGGTKPNLRIYLYVMNGILRSGDTDLLLELWKKSKDLAIYQARQGIRPRKSTKWILANKSPILCQIFSVVINALTLVQRPADIIWEMEHLFYHGFKLDNVNINDIVQGLASSGMIKKAFELCELELMPGCHARKLHRKGDFSERPKFYPFLRTLECLITEVKAFQLAEGEYRGLRPSRRHKILRELEKRCPGTWAELNDLKNVEHSVAKEQIYRESREDWRTSSEDIDNLIISHKISPGHMHSEGFAEERTTQEPAGGVGDGQLALDKNTSKHQAVHHGNSQPAALQFADIQLKQPLSPITQTQQTSSTYTPSRPKPPIPRQDVEDDD